MMKRKLTILLTIVFIGFVGVGLYDLRDSKVKLELNEIQLQDRLIELNQLKLQKEQLNQEFEEAVEEKDTNVEKVRELEEQKLQLEQRTRDLEAQLQAKRTREANERSVANVGVTRKASAQPAVTGNKETWLRQSGIPQSEWWAVDYIVSRESSWNPNAVNPSSGACGLAQQLPCGKWAGAWNDPVSALKAQYQYVIARYGGYPQAVSFWKVNHWY